MSDLRPRELSAVPLAELADRLGIDLVDRGSGEPEAGTVAVTGVTLDSRAVLAGDLFAALPGEHHHGARFAPVAIEAGAVAVFTDPDGLDALGGAHGAGVPVLVVDNPRSRLGALSALVYGNPSAAIDLVGVTGTNGKTTTSYLLEGAMTAGGRTTALLGTIETRIAGARLTQTRTTPEAPALQALLAVARERAVTAAVMEVSSHALALGRVAGTTFVAAVFTNLSEEHLDFHEDMEAYFAAKASLFRRGVVGTAIICVDDEYGVRLMEKVPLAHVTYSATGVPWADWQVADLRPGPLGTEFTAHGPAGETVPVRVPMPGNVNVANALGALAAAVACGFDPVVSGRGISAVTGVPGRLEAIDAGQDFAAFVDYAHTPRAVDTLLQTLREVTPGRLVIVLGCGGDRDRGKRGPMARAAVAGADLAIFTSDNPRSEDPGAILAEMTTGLDGDFRVDADRYRAICLAVQGLAAGDTVVVAGKGHETGQERDGRVTPFDDRVELRSAITGNDRVAP